MVSHAFHVCVQATVRSAMIGVKDERSKISDASMTDHR